MTACLVSFCYLLLCHSPSLHSLWDLTDTFLGVDETAGAMTACVWFELRLAEHRVSSMKYSVIRGLAVTAAPCVCEGH